MNNLSTPVKVGGAVFVVAATSSLFFLNNKRLLIYFLIGVLAVLLLVAITFLVLHLVKKAKEKAREKELTHIDPAEKTDEVVAKFEEGIRKFKSNGKNLYSIPWYAFIGAPGSGKTWAIRNSGIVFPPEFSGAVKGHSGTKGMDWWLSDDAILLDTAGEMTVQEDLNAKIVSDKMWSTFLDKLKKFRPREPINGIFLAIPAESLLVDSSEEIDVKAGQILSRLRSLQENLQVRFPLYIIITKCDKICGFREFWETLDEVPDFKLKEKLQGQMLGWCNSDKLDAPFRIDGVYESLNALVKRLKSYRLGLLTPSKDSDIQAKTAALYSFPENLGKVAQRLELYLQKILPTAPSSWDKEKNKPLFVRGLYFTSAMQEGSVYDDAVAQLTGLSLDEISPSTERKENKYYFLRDVFLKKSLNEQGLVSNSNNAQQQYKKRKLLVLSAAIAAICALIGLSVYSSQTLKKNIGNHNDVWAKANDELNWEDGNWRPLVHRQNDALVFDERKPVEFAGQKYTSIDFLSLLKDYSTKPIEIPLIFRALTISSTSNEEIQRLMKDSLSKIYTMAAIKPAVEVVEKGFADSEQWSELKTKSLIEIIKLRTVPDKIDQHETVNFIDLGTFYKLSLPAAEFTEYEQHSKVMNSFLTDEYWRDSTYPPRLLQIDGFEFEKNQNLKKGIERFADSLADLDEVKELQSTVKVLNDLGDEFENFEKFTNSEPLDTLQGLLEDWQSFEQDKFFDNNDVFLINTLDKYKDLEDLLSIYEQKREAVLNSIASIRKAESSIRSGYETVNASLQKILTSEQFKESANLIDAYRTALRVTEAKLQKYAREIVYIKSEEPEDERRIAFKKRVSNLIASVIKTALRQDIDLSDIEDSYSDSELKYKFFKENREKRMATFKEVEDRYNIFYQDILEVKALEPVLGSWKEARQQLVDLTRKAAAVTSAFNTKAVEEKSLYQTPAKAYTAIFNAVVKSKILSLSGAVASNEQLNNFEALIAEADAPRTIRLKKLSSEKFPKQFRPEILLKIYDDWSAYFDYLQKQQDYVLDENAFADNKTTSLDKLKDYFQTYASYWTEDVHGLIVEYSEAWGLALSLKEIPLTSIGPEGMQLNPKYSYETAEIINAALVEPMAKIGDEELKSILEDSYYGVYSEEYILYWKDEVYRELLDLKPRKRFKNWTAVANEILNFNKSSMNIIFRENLATVEEQIARMVSELKESSHENRLEEATTILGGLESAIKSSRRSLEIKKIRELVSLGDTFLEARSEIMSLEKDDFERDLMISDADNNVYVNYWRNMSLTAMEVLADEYQQAMREKFTNIQNGLKFPLIADAAQEYTSSDLNNLFRTISELKVNQEKSDDTLLHKSVRDRDYNKLLVNLRGQIFTRSEEENVARLQKLSDALKRNQSYELFLLDVNTQRQENATAYEVWRAIQVNTYDKRNTTSPKVRLVKIKGLNTPLTINLYQHASDEKPHRVINIASNWPVLKMMLGDSQNQFTFFVAEPDEEGKNWTIFLGVKDDAGQMRRLLLQVNFDWAMPKLSEWPRFE